MTTITERVDTELRRILTQYRESPKLIHAMRVYLTQIAQLIEKIDEIPSKFDLDTAVGDQLTLLGKRLGWPRCHCICVTQPVFGFDCVGVPQDFPIVGFCEPGTWRDCGEFGVGDICINDDEIYRGFLSARRYQILSFYDRDSLTDALQSIWGPLATVVDDGNRRVVMSPGRELTGVEVALLQLVPRVLPIAPGILQRYHFLSPRVFGFGDGWGEFCELEFPEGLPLVTEEGITMVTENDEPILTGPLTQDAPWMCEFDLKPYECPE